VLTAPTESTSDLRQWGVDSPDDVRLVGILNVTPDSFSDGGRYLDPARAVEHGRELVAQGAWAVDVGGESTRPGAASVSIDEELDRIVPVITQLAGDGVFVSVDTRRPDVAEHAVLAGARLINDVGGLRDPRMVEIAVAHSVSVVVMHSPTADPAQAHRHRGYDDVVADVVEFVATQAAAALAAGVPGIVVDPGLGFGKTLEDNVRLITHLDELTALGHPVLVGASRKRFVGTLAGVDDAADRDVATIAAHLAAVARGARLLRVHDVAAHTQALRVWTAIDTRR